MRGCRETDSGCIKKWRRGKENEKLNKERKRKKLKKDIIDISLFLCTLHGRVERGLHDTC